ncbi:MAG: YhjD/YihY/BrkB family envelope integrity protein, partial [Mycobacteriales bacterium]
MPSPAERLQTQRDRRPWLDRLVRAATRYNNDNGNHFAAAITYFSVLALFPLLLLLLSVAGFVLSGHPQLLAELRTHIDDAVPGARDTVKGIVDDAIKVRGATGIIGLLGVAYAGLGWIANLRTAIQAVWGLTPPKENFFAAKGRDLIALVGLGLSLLLSVALTAAGTAATGFLVRLVHVDHVTGIGVVTRVIGLLIAVGADVLIFAWVFARLPRHKVPLRTVVAGALFAAIGFEVLKVFGTYYIARVAQSPTGAAIGGAIGLLIWANLVSRFLLFVTAWTAEAAGAAGAADAAGAGATRPAPRSVPAVAEAIDAPAGGLAGRPDAAAAGA